MDGWMDGWMDEWVDGWMDGWMDGWVDGWVGRSAPFFQHAMPTSVSLSHLGNSRRISNFFTVIILGMASLSSGVTTTIH
ncbi:hypothetical protein FD754_020118 [Muntiacus muntjak]|uniref:Uncharacterized protein n=1 Tax=Muntiacus muntjak TaxID=9888 RepID=A0A5N3V205_MUNMU|nr:hypothetical protein FD754_020118 [Muntiacus muntjak]